MPSRAVDAPRSPRPDELAQALSVASAWPGGSDPPDWVQTHLSHVFLLGDRVYKLRKSVEHAFVDFGSRETRNADCLREVALNRRLAPSVYLGVAPVLAGPDGARIGDVSEKLLDEEHEHVVVMRRLPEGTDALTLVEQGHLDARALEGVAEQIARMHGEVGLGVPTPYSPSEWLEHVAAPMRANVASLRAAPPGSLDHDLLESVNARLETRLEELAPGLERRRLEGRAVDGHGDLHLDHVWLEPGQDAVLMDCVEFNEELRRIDAASEVAFLAMDLRYRGRPDLAEAFLGTYAMLRDDYGLYSVVDLYASYRAMVRAKVAALAAVQPTVDAAQRDGAWESVGRHMRLGAELLAESAPGGLLVVCGTIGTGKSAVTRALLRKGVGVPIVSDRVRKARVGASPDARLRETPDTGLYTPEQRSAVYEAMLERAAPVVASKRTPIFDATFDSRARRATVLSWAKKRGIVPRLLEVRCDPELVRERLARRAAEGADPSDAGPDLLATSLARWEPPDEWPEEHRFVVHTDDPSWESGLGMLSRSLR